MDFDGFTTRHSLANSFEIHQPFFLGTQYFRSFSQQNEPAMDGQYQVCLCRLVKCKEVDNSLHYRKATREQKGNERRTKRKTQAGRKTLENSHFRIAPPTPNTGKRNRQKATDESLDLLALTFDYSTGTYFLKNWSHLISFSRAAGH